MRSSTWKGISLEDYIPLFPRLALPLSSAEQVGKQECDTNRELPVLSSPLCLQTGTEDWRKGGNRRNRMQKKGKWKKMEQIIYEQAFKEHRVTSNNKWKAKSIWGESHCFKTCLQLKAASRRGAVRPLVLGVWPGHTYLLVNSQGPCEAKRNTSVSSADWQMAPSAPGLGTNGRTASAGASAMDSDIQALPLL